MGNLKVIIELRQKGVTLTPSTPLKLIKKYLEDFPDLKKHIEDGKGNDKPGKKENP